MLFCAKWLTKLSTQHGRVVTNRLKPAQFSHFSSNDQIRFLFNESSRKAGVCTCIPNEIFNDTKFNFSTSCNSGLLTSASRCNWKSSPHPYQYHSVKFYCSSAAEPEKKPSLLQRFKQMYKEYWYVLVPVHLLTSTIWFSSFYYLAKSGVDIAGCLEAIGAGEKLVQKLRSGNSTMGYIAISYALYKIATPVRYTVTLGGTTLSIKYLRDWGYIKPIPPKDKIKEIIHEKKDILLEKKRKFKKSIRRKGFRLRDTVKSKVEKGRLGNKE